MNGIHTSLSDQGTLKSAGQHAGNRERRAVEDELAADQVLRAAVSRLPHPIADRRRAGALPGDRRPAGKPAREPAVSPSRVKKSADTKAPFSRSGSRSPVRLTLCDI